MRLILTTDVYELGNRGEVVDVAPGYGRNFLIPRKLALLATPGNIKAMEQQKEILARQEAKHRDEAEMLARELTQTHILISRKAGDTGVLFGSVTSKDIGDVLESQGIHLDRRRILLPQPLKSIGTTKVEARPHNDVEATLLVSVIPEDDEPVAKTIPRGVESDKIIEDLEAKVQKIEQAAGLEKEALREVEASEAVEEGPEEDAEEKQAVKSTRPETDQKESV